MTQNMFAQLSNPPLSEPFQANLTFEVLAHRLRACLENATGSVLPDEVADFQSMIESLSSRINAEEQAPSSFQERREFLVETAADVKKSIPVTSKVDHLDNVLCAIDRLAGISGTFVENATIGFVVLPPDPELSRKAERA